MHAHGAGFLHHAHFKKKWCKRVYLAILDCGLLNALVAWNESTKEYSPSRKHLKGHDLCTHIAQSMCGCIDTRNMDKDKKPEAIATEHKAMPCFIQDVTHKPIHNK